MRLREKLRALATVEFFIEQEILPNLERDDVYKLLDNNSNISVNVELGLGSGSGPLYIFSGFSLVNRLFKFLLSYFVIGKLDEKF